MYQKLLIVIDSVNIVIEQYDVPDMGELLCLPEEGMVAFGSGFEQWGFTITHFARMYCSSTGLPLPKMMAMLWGDWFYNKKKKTFTTDQYKKNGKVRKRAFCKFILDPIIKITKISYEGTMEQTRYFYKKLTYLKGNSASSIRLISRTRNGSWGLAESCVRLLCRSG
jgi:translation elongation factor EF-G